MEETTPSFFKKEQTTVVLVLLLPTLLLLLGYVLNPYPPSPLAQQLVLIPLFLSLILLGIGFFWRQQQTGCLLKMLGWGVFSFYWATQTSFLYISEGGDVFNAAVCIIGVYVLIYLGYHEWLAFQRKEMISALQWIAGATFLAGIIYFTIDSGIIPGLKEGLIEVVAAQSAGVLQLFGFTVQQTGGSIFYNETIINIIFACTAIQSMVIFVGMNGALQHISLKRKLGVIVLMVGVIYVLNLIRNASVIYLVGNNITSFNIAHNYIGKAGSLLALIVLLFVNFKLVPHLYDEIYGIIDLPKRNGPVERLLLPRKRNTS